MQKPVKPAPVILLILTILFVTVSLSNGQNFKFKKYGIQQGICHPFVYTVNQDKNGFIWIGTGDGLCRFDGFEFKSDIVDDSLERDVVISSFKDSKGNLWFGFQDGTVSSYNGKLFTVIKPLSEIKSSIVGFDEYKEGSILAASMNEGIMVIDGDKEIRRLNQELAGKFISSVCLDDNRMIIGSQEGLEIYDLNDFKTSPKKTITIKELSYIKIQDIKKALNKEGFWLATEDNGVFFLTVTTHTYKLLKIGDSFNLGSKNVQSVCEDSESNLWLSTFRDGVYKLEGSIEKDSVRKISIINKSNGLPNDFIKNIFEDREGNIWIATYGDGLALSLNNAFSFYTYDKEKISSNILSICSVNNEIFLGSRSGLFKSNNQTGQNMLLNKYGLPQDEVTALFYDHERTLWIGTAKNGLYKLDIHTNKITRFNYNAASLGRSVNSISGNKSILYLGTKDGIYYFDLTENKTQHYTTYNGLPHNNIEQVFTDNENNLLFATRANGIFEIDVLGEIHQRFQAGNYEIDFNSISQDINGNIWASTYGSGIFHFTHDSIVFLTATDGLKSDYCYSIISSDEDYIWVGHRLGISRINIKNYSTKIYDLEQGITGDCNLNSVYKDNTGNIYFGTTEGLIHYNPAKDKRAKIAPKTNITRLLINDKPVEITDEILLPYSRYKIRIDFIGLNFNEPEAVNYQYKLEGFDPDWSDITNINYIVYPRIQDGRYKFIVRSFTKDGKGDANPVGFEFRVKLPFYKTWWFISLSFVVLVLLVWLIIKIRERKQKQLQDYLEKSLAERTREVVEQKEEIEIKNRDITDSITYAQRIQSSILPPLKRLQVNFNGAFVFYQPRDIVSGDFYWFDKVSDTKFIIVCADSTGHGVPGAFMSMIGTTLLKDICSREPIKSPSEILRNLDQELRNTLNQNMESEKPNDGMDIIVCEIDLRTNYVRYASAMRPMVIYKDGEEYYIKGSRSSVGGHYDKIEKDFQDEGIQLTQGDLIYMFSDGYPDQFGGPMGKKFKMVRLRNLLEDINKKPMDEQYNHVKNSFTLWKEGYPQVDDVLFMGIKL